jgi:hypothetical protein
MSEAHIFEALMGMAYRKWRPVDISMFGDGACFVGIFVVGLVNKMPYIET